MSVADQLAEAITPWWTQDFEDFVRAIGAMFAHAELYCADVDEDDGSGGWEAMLDPDQSPTEALPYLAQWVGEVLRAGMTDEQMREWVKGRPNSRRGTPNAIGLAAQRSLTGGRTVQVFERTKNDGTPDPNGDEFVVYTYAAETPNPSLVWSDLQDVIPADMVCHYTVLTAATWASIESGHSTWAAVKSAYPTWTEVRSGVGGGTDWAAV
jgi:hypothetical protein